MADVVLRFRLVRGAQLDVRYDDVGDEADVV